jgi:ribosomal protein L21E
MSEFKVGDKVRVSKRGAHPDFFVGRVGHVVSDAEGVLYPYEVKFSDHGDAVFEVFAAEEIVLVDDEPVDTQVSRGGFKAGDRVRIVRSPYWTHPGRQAGATGTVEDWLPADEGTVHLTLDSAESGNAKHWLFPVEDLEHLADEGEPDYGTSGETNLTYKATDEPNHRVEALFAALQSFGPDTTTSTTARIVKRAEEFLKFLEGKND